METLTKYIGQISRCSILYRTAALEPLGLNGYQHSYIIHICQNPGISQDQLAKKIFVNKSNVARQLLSLEENGFITRVPHGEDRRQMQVFPTEKALEVYPKVLEVLHQWNRHLLKDFTPEEEALLLSLMERIMHQATTPLSQNSNATKEKL